MPAKIDDWQVIGQLGSGGQSIVSLVRSSKRKAERDQLLQSILRFRTIPPGGLDAEEFAESIHKFTRPDEVSELGALKQFRIRGSEQQAINRLEQEVTILQQNRRGLPTLLDANVPERWMVTEYFPEKTLDANYSLYRGNSALALTAFLSLVETVEALHREKIIHRDIKPANIFLRSPRELVLGDFGIVFLPDRPNRITFSNESVGPYDYMPPWADLGGRLDKIEPSFDVYMLGKLLWCMVSGRLRLPREWFKQSEYDVTVMFEDDPHMHMVNKVLEKCLVEDPKSCISTSALLLLTRNFVSAIEHGGQLLGEGVPRRCRICGLGHYQQIQVRAGDPTGLIRLWHTSGGATDITHLPVRSFVCDSCGHIQFFKI